MTALVFGRTGQVARALARVLPDATFLSRSAADLADPAACAAAIAASNADVVINAAAYTAVDRAEEEEALATRINGAAPGAMAAACAAKSIPFLHVSTDYVFDGSGTAPWKPDNPTGPLSAYGRSKLAGERAIADAGGQWAVLRTSWVVSAHGSNFVTTMLRLGAERDALNIVADQHGGPTPARDIATTLAEMAHQMRADAGKGGLHHFAGQPATTWADFARAIFAGAGITCAVNDITTADWPAPAPRPANSRLDCAALTEQFGITPPAWAAGLQEILDELKDTT